MKIKLGEQECDLSEALPITLGDIRRLKKEYKVKLEDLASMDVDVVACVLLMLARKVHPEVTEEMIDCLELFRLNEVAVFLGTATIPERPTSGSSTS